MKNLKFRAFTGTMMQYDVMVGKFGAFYINPGLKGDGLDQNDSACLTHFNTIFSEQTPIMQSTGIKDINDKEIFEGDIIKRHFKDGKTDHFLISPVVWVEGLAAYSISADLLNNRMFQEFDNHDELRFEVIGNIYENPELEI
jgi:uncharacterized phage protein (TIGR01671 family)